MAPPAELQGYFWSHPEALFRGTAEKGWLVSGVGFLRAAYRQPICTHYVQQKETLAAQQPAAVTELIKWTLCLC